jgi:dephospho-CoA kinase
MAEPDLLPPPPRSAPRTFVVGLLGGIASGKSTVARTLAGADGVVIEADALAHRELARAETLDFLRREFGIEVLGPDGLPDRPALARRVFADPQARARLEGWIHPRVRDTIRDALAAARAAAAPIAVIDVPLLLENDATHALTDECHALVFVDAPEEFRERRARADRGWAPGEVRRREAAQWPLAQKRARATHCLSNHGDREQLARAAAELRATLLGASGPRG